MGWSERAQRRRLPCAQSRTPSSSAPQGRLMVLRPSPALPDGLGSRGVPPLGFGRTLRLRESAEDPRREASRSVEAGTRRKSLSSRCCLQYCRSQSLPTRGPGEGVPGRPQLPPPPLRLVPPPAPVRPLPALSLRPPVPGPHPLSTPACGPSPLRAVPTFLALERPPRSLSPLLLLEVPNLNKIF